MNLPLGVSSREALRHEVGAEVDENCICASACSLIWFGGVQRTGQVGVHRSYFSSNAASMSFKDYSKALQSSHSAISEYLEEMRVPPRVFETLAATPSDEVHFIGSPSYELDNPLRLDPLFSEYLLANCPSSLSASEHETLGSLSVIDMTGYELNKNTQLVPRELSLPERQYMEQLQVRAIEESQCIEKVITRVQADSQGTP